MTCSSSRDSSPQAALRGPVQAGIFHNLGTALEGLGVSFDRVAKFTTYFVHSHFIAGDQVESAEIEGIADSDLMDEAYPEIKEGVRSFIESYLAGRRA